MRPCPTETSFAGEKPEIPVLDAEDPVKQTFDAFFSSSPPSGRGEGKAGQSGRTPPGSVRAGMHAAAPHGGLRRLTRIGRRIPALSAANFHAPGPSDSRPRRHARRRKRRGIPPSVRKTVQRASAPDRKGRRDIRPIGKERNGHRPRTDYNPKPNEAQQINNGISTPKNCNKST